jgi:hypothetical protein
MDSVLRGWVIGYLLGHAIDRHRQPRAHWGVVAYAEITGLVWAYHHRSARQAEKLPWPSAQAPPPGCGPAEPTSPSRWPATGRPPACPPTPPPAHWPDAKPPTPTRGPRPPPRLARAGPRHPSRRALPERTPHHPITRISPPSGGVTPTPQASGGRGAAPNPAPLRRFGAKGCCGAGAELDISSQHGQALPDGRPLRARDTPPLHSGPAARQPPGRAARRRPPQPEQAGIQPPAQQNVDGVLDDPRGKANTPVSVDA